MFKTIIAALIIATAQADKAEKVCVQGYPMDKFCIQSGFLLDGGLPTLPNADQHTVHCLADVPQCLDSGYEVMAKPTTAGGNFSRVCELDTMGANMMLEAVRKIGNCTTCATNGTLKVGYNATFIGTYNSSFTGMPPQLIVEEIHPATADCDALLSSSSPSGGFSPLKVFVTAFAATATVSSLFVF